MVNVTSAVDDSESKQLPDCIPSDNGPVLTDLGRMQVKIYSFCPYIGKYKNVFAITLNRLKCLYCCLNLYVKIQVLGLMPLFLIVSIQMYQFFNKTD